MTQDDINKVDEILADRPFQVRTRLAEWRKTITVTEKEITYPKRTDQQRKAYFEWLEQIAQQCNNAGVTADVLFKHTAHISITKDLLHHCVKTLIKAKWNLESTNDLRKTGHLDEIQDSMAGWVGKENVEIPPFPSEEVNLSGVKLAQHNNLSNDNYSEYTEPTI
jgi:hypothetical protein